MQLARAVEMCTLRHSLETGEQCSAAELAAALQRRGYAARICKSEGGGSGTAAFRNLRHTFLKVEAGSTGAWWAQPAQQADRCDAASEEEAPECIVDCHFACQVRLKQGAWIMKAVHFMLHKAMCAVQVFAGPASSFSASAQAMPDTYLPAPYCLQFVVANPTPRFAALLSLLPQTFVGSAEQLEHVVEWVCR